MTGVPLGSSPLTIAVLSTEPLSTSAWVKIYTPVNVLLSVDPTKSVGSGPPITVTIGS